MKRTRHSRRARSLAAGIALGLALAGGDAMAARKREGSREPHQKGNTIGDTLEVALHAMGGGGGSAGSAGGGQLAVRPSPGIAVLDLGFRHNDIRWLEIAPGAQCEFGDRIGFGLVLKLRAFVPIGRRVHPYALVGAPTFLAPYKLFGVQLGGGIVLDLHRVVGIVVEIPTSIFFAGNDLTKGSALAKVDAMAGLRITF